jgi:acetyl esterase/lipase
MTVEKVTEGGVPCELLSFPGAGASRLILYFHGGGNAVGSLDSHRQIACHVALSADCPVLNVGFRVGPEDPFPAAVEDAIAVYTAVLEAARAPASVAIAGDSAGAGIGVALLLTLRDSGQRLPACAVLISPCLDLSLSGQLVNSGQVGDPGFTVEAARRLFDAYLGSADPRHPLASPAFADPTGLPPLLIQAGSLEAYLEEAAAFASAATIAGVETVFEEYEGQVHDFQAVAPSLPESVAALRSIGTFLKSKMASPA